MDGPVFRTENEEGQISQEEHQAECPQKLSDHGPSEKIPDETKIAQDPKQKPNDCSTW